MIEQYKISLISNKTYKEGGQRIPEAVIERDYCMAWFLVGLSRSPLKEKLVFKGGTALRRCYFRNYRFSEDLDFTLLAPIPLDKILEGFKEIFELLNDEVGINFDIGKLEPDNKNTHTFYIQYEGPLPKSGNPKEVKVDITFNEKVITMTQEKAIIKTYEEYSDLPQDAKIKTYSLEEVAIEKVSALLDPARNEPRDLYDMWFLISENKIELSELINGIQEKIAFKGGTLEERRNNLLKKEKRLEKLWKTRLSVQMMTLPPFDLVFRVVKRAFRQSGLM